MVTRLFPERVLPWLEQIKDYFHHPTEESLSAYVANPTCVYPLVYVKPEAMKSPTLRGTILFSSEESIASSDGLIHRSRATRIGPNVKPPGGSEAVIHMEPATMDPEVTADEPVQERPEVQTQPGVQTGSTKVTGSRFRRSTTRSSKPTVLDISSIPGPESPPVAVFGESPVRDHVHPEHVKGNGPEGVVKYVFVEKVQPSTLHGVVFRERVEGIKTDMESNEATPPVTQYTCRVPSGDEGCGHSEGQGSSDSSRSEANGSWMAHNPACDNLPHASRWSRVQGSWIDSLDNCHEFYSMSLPPTEHLYKKNKDRFRLLDDHVRLGVNYFATTQEIVREWRSMGEQIMKFEAEKREFVANREKFNAEKKGFNWRVSDTDEKLAKE
ncbi:hypothetical protein HanXRQr2_Chr02g0068351 [Helianthus annuus]|uniref:Uncharacterized protein n=1 Tax=Helianthus annuus TaxID=4232 RepID=A0A9K3JNV6_HELAN|nr:hypothetical protein HanXRQr2_Chr02g0068351 [Helianthus annuus]KAJ0604890.1 hypothetical protein HanHA300_Chr02g0056791 [Helianthus annuus]KAJ0618907.1 hypothetical protein HanHA89_Chr02g0065311 [Helianthus annuus]KAJ0951952.1 hypothetical protein HanPSC8_Chr02g0066441 [Helianthus annuus]